MNKGLKLSTKCFIFYFYFQKRNTDLMNKGLKRMKFCFYFKVY